MSVLISIVVPVYNEEKNISILYRKIKAAFAKMPGKDFEVIFVDDGSTDASLSEIKRLGRKDKRVKEIAFTRNFGQTFAWDAGIRLSKGRYIVTIDADLQNDPADIKLLYDKLLKGYDVVSGWRVKRIDSLSKKFFSSYANALRRLLIKEEIHDSGCSLKIYKR